MKLHWSPRSPFVRKVMIVAHEVGIVDRLDCVRSVAAATKPHLELMKDNPLSKIPALVLDDGAPLFDSRAICEYFDTLHTGSKLFPTEPKARWIALRRQSLGDGMLDFLILWRAEGERQHPSDIHFASFAARRVACLASLENEAEALGNSPFSIGHIAVGCALSYLDFRFAAQPWRDDHPKLAAWHRTFSARPSAQATEPIDDSHIKS
jgi:glutathione S-transferase